MGSVGSSQYSRCVFSKFSSSRLSIFGKSEISLSQSCEGIVISSSSISVSNLTLPSSDNFTSPVSCCDMFLDHAEFCFHSVLPLDPPKKLNPGHGHLNVADLGNREVIRDYYWLQFNSLFNYTEDTTPTHPQSVGTELIPRDRT